MIRVLDIYKTNGRVENGNNVQIYTNTDPIAQEWLILPVDADNFRIVPRSNMRLSLTSYGSDSGTASGRTSASAGNVFVSTYTGNNPNQLWQIYKTDRTQVKNDYIGNISSNTYYVINRESGNLIKNTNNSLLLSKGTSDIAMISNAWKITKIDTNTYTVQPENRSDLFLCGNTTAKTVSLQGAPNHYWSSEPAAGIGGLRLTMRSGSTKYALTESNGSLVLQTVSTQSGTSAYYRQAWYFYAVDTYTVITKATFSNLNISYGNTASAKVTSVQPTGAAMTAASNFTYTGGGQVVSIDNLTGTFKGLNNGTVTITATHKVHTNVKATFSITVTGKPDPEPEPEEPLYNPNPPQDNTLSNDTDKNVTLKDGRYFRIPHDDLEEYGQLDANQLCEMLASKGLDGEVEILYQNCVEIIPNIGSEYAVNKMGYLEYSSHVNHRPLVELLRRTKVAVIFTHANSTTLKLDTKSDFDSSALYLTSEKLSALPDNYFNYCQLILLICCGDHEQPAYNTTNLESVIEVLAQKGAQNVIGFKHEAFAQQATLFEYNFFNYLNADPNIAGLLLNDLPDFPSGDLRKENKEYTVQTAFEKAVEFVDAQTGGTLSENAILISNGDIAIRPYEKDLQG